MARAVKGPVSCMSASSILSNFKELRPELDMNYPILKLGSKRMSVSSGLRLVVPEK